MKISTVSFLVLLLIFNPAQQVYAAQVKVGLTIVPPATSLPLTPLPEPLPPPSTTTTTTILSPPPTTIITPILPPISTVPPVIPPPSLTTTTVTAEFFSSTISNEVVIPVGGSAVGTKVALPPELSITAPSWNGTVNVTYLPTPSTPTTPVAGVVSAKSVSIDFGGVVGEVIKLNKASLITIPYPDFATVANPMVKIVDATNVPYVLNLCTDTQYLSPGLLDKPSSYFLPAFATGGAQHCYKFDDQNVYMASNHFSLFVVGVAQPVSASSTRPSPAPEVGGGGGGNYHFVSSTPVILPVPPVEPPLPPVPVAEIPLVEIPPPRPLDRPVIRPACRFTSIQPKKVYKDVALDTWYSAAVSYFGDMPALQKTKPFFLPAAPLRRYEALVLAMDAFGVKPVKKLLKNPFIDVTRRDSFSKYVQSALDNGIVAPNNSYFSPTRVINRAEAVAILLRAGKADIKNYSKRTFSYYRDVPIDKWYFPYITKASDLCIIVGYTDLTVRANQPVTRAEFVVMLDRTLQRLKK